MVGKKKNDPNHLPRALSRYRDSHSSLAFSSKSYAETLLTADSDAIIVAYPYSLYVTVASDISQDLSAFEIFYWFEDRDPETLTEEEKKEGSIVPEKEIIV